MRKLRIRKSEEIHAYGIRYVVEVEDVEHTNILSTVVGEEDGWFPWFPAKRKKDAEKFVALVESGIVNIDDFNTIHPEDILLKDAEDNKDWNNWDKLADLY